MVGLLGVGVLLRAANLMLTKSERLTNAMNRQFRQEPPRVPRRGYILDRNHEPIAVSMEVKSLYANPNKIENKQQIALWLSKALNLPATIVKGKLRVDKGFVWLKRQLTETELAAVEDLLDQHPTLNATLGLAKESKRFYPNQALASQIMGFTGMDTNGLEGVELFYDDLLKGSSNSDLNRDGNSLLLTIDRALQYTLEEELARGFKDTGSLAVTAMVMNANNGDILAMGTYPNFNGNRLNISSPDARRNRSLTDLYEPGSTMKPVLVSGALEQGMVTTETKVFCEYGKLQIGKHWVREAEAKDRWGWMTIGEVLQKSSNVGATKIGFIYGAENTFNWYKKLGVTKKTGIDLPGEAGGYVPPVDKWQKIHLSNIAFGQGVSVTPLQMIRAYAAFANGGYLVKPRILKQVLSFEGELQKEIPYTEKKRVMESKTAKTIVDMLEAVPTVGGTAPKAAIDGYSIVGKTGTAQKPIPGRGYRGGKYVASFIGFARDVNPNYVVYVMVDEPKFPHFGGEAAAPIFRRIMTAVLAKEGIAPSATGRIELAAAEKKIIPSKAEKSLTKIEQKWRTVSSAVEKSKPGEVAAASNASGNFFIMPNLLGSTAREVLDTLNQKGIIVKLKGSGVTVQQSPEAGANLSMGDTVNVRLERDFL